MPSSRPFTESRPDGLNEAVKRNLERFPPDFMFQLTAAEHAALISQIATSKPGRGGRRKLPWVFTEHGAIQAANVLNSPRAVEMGIYVVRAMANKISDRFEIHHTPVHASWLNQAEIAIGT
jgi:hypothetical protein